MLFKLFQGVAIGLDYKWFSTITHRTTHRRCIISQPNGNALG